jgi:hypothetical protein
MKKIIGIVTAFSALALLLGVMACGGTTTVAAPITWIALYGPTPVVSEASTLSLDFSAPVAELQAGLTAERLNSIFSFAYYKDGSTSPEVAAIRAVTLTPDDMGGMNTYRLQVSGASATTGRIDVTINRSDIQPNVRSWFLDGSVDYSPPVIREFRFFAADGSPLGQPGSITPGASGTYAIAVTVPASAEVTKLTPKITLNPGNTVSPGDHIEMDFTAPVSYQVKSGNGASKTTYVVTVTKATS